MLMIRHFAQIFLWKYRNYKYNIILDFTIIMQFVTGLLSGSTNSSSVTASTKTAKVNIYEKKKCGAAMSLINNIYYIILYKNKIIF